MDYKQQIEELKKQIEELEKAIEGNEKVEIPRLSEYYKIYTVNDCIYVGKYDDKDSLSDKFSRNIGNYFETHEEAEFYAKKWTAQQKLQRLADIVNGGRYKFGSNIFNWNLMLCADNEISSDYIAVKKPNTVYFSSKENALKAYKSLSKDEQEALWS
jgi:hypothetical protein